MRRRLGLLLTLFLFVPGCAGGDSEAARGDLFLTADRLFDGRRLIENGGVLITGDKIVAAGADLDAEAKRRIDLGDATLLPGFIDLHVHLGGSADSLIGGVTTVRNLGNFIGSMEPPQDRPGSLRILHAGPLLTVPGGYPIPVHGRDVGLPFRGVEGARRAVALVAERGAVVVKLALEPGFGNQHFPVPTRQEVEAVVQEAHARGLKVTAHTQRGSAARLALDSGVDELAHLPCCAATPSLMRELARSGMPVAGTLHVQQGAPDLERNAEIFVRAGGKLLYATDYPNRPIPPGIDVEELKLMVSAGMTPTEAISAATAEAGELLGMEPLGMLVEGAPADVIGVGGNPFSRLDVLEDPVLVVAGGVPVVAEGKLNLPGF